MDEMTADPSLASAAPALAPASFWTWLGEGLRAGFLLRPRVRGTPAPLQLVLLLALVIVIEVPLARLEIAGPAQFNLAAWLAPWWSEAAFLLLVWVLLARQPAAAGQDRPAGVAAWTALWFAGALPFIVLGQALIVLQARGLLPEALEASPLYAWASFALVWGWMLAVPVALGRRFGMDARRLGALAVGLAAIQGVTAWQFSERPWYATAPAVADTPRLRVSQEAFEQQQALWHQAVGALAPQRPAVRDVYGVVFAPYASEDVFLRESTMVSGVLAQRFDAEGRVLHLVNHATTSDRLPWATPVNLRRAIAAIAQRMDLEPVSYTHLTLPTKRIV